MAGVKSSSNPQLDTLLRGRVQAVGSLPFSEFMRSCLYEPGLGYYANGARVGKSGDFYTSVSVGPLFGELMARQFLEVANYLEKDAFTICEQGANDGTFAADVLGWIKERRPDVFAKIQYRIIEPISVLQAKQRAKLEQADVVEKCAWAESLDALEPFDGVFFSNELVDAFPVELLVWRGGGWKEKRVVLEGEQFTLKESEISSEALKNFASRLPEGWEGYEVEANLEMEKWLAGVGRKLQSGVVMTVDYGFRRDREEGLIPTRAQGTLSCYSTHQRGENPLINLGTQDITAHVDFSELIRAGQLAGLLTEGYVDQHHALVGLAERYFVDEPLSEKQLRAFKQLMHPEKMGTQFKLLVQSKNITLPRLSCLQFERL